MSSIDPGYFWTSERGTGRPAWGIATNDRPKVHGIPYHMNDFFNFVAGYSQMATFEPLTVRVMSKDGPVANQRVSFEVLEIGLPPEARWSDSEDFDARMFGLVGPSISLVEGEGAVGLQGTPGASEKLKILKAAKARNYTEAKNRSKKAMKKMVGQTAINELRKYRQGEDTDLDALFADFGSQLSALGTDRAGDALTMMALQIALAKYNPEFYVETARWLATEHLSSHQFPDRVLNMEASDLADIGFWFETSFMFANPWAVGVSFLLDELGVSGVLLDGVNYLADGTMEAVSAIQQGIYDGLRALSGPAREDWTAIPYPPFFLSVEPREGYGHDPWIPFHVDTNAAGDATIPAMRLWSPQ